MELIATVIVSLAAVIGAIWGAKQYGVDLYKVGVAGCFVLVATLYLGMFGLVATNGPSAVALLSLAMAMVGAPLGAYVAEVHDRL